MKFTGSVKLNVNKLKGLKKELAHVQGSEVRVGVFADKADRGETGTFTESGYKEGKDALNNAEIGAVHELGSKAAGIPMRSFLRVPCLEDLPKQLKERGGKQLIGVMLKEGTEAALENLGVMAEQTVDEAFESRGKGRWAPLKPATIRNRKHGGDAPLFDSGKLAASISSVVIMKGATK